MKRAHEAIACRSPALSTSHTRNLKHTFQPGFHFPLYEQQNLNDQIHTINLLYTYLTRIHVTNNTLSPYSFPLFPFCLKTHFRCIDLSNTKTCTQVLFNESPPFYTMVFATIPPIPRSVQRADWQVWYDIHINDAVATPFLLPCSLAPPNLNHLWKPILLAIFSLSRMFHTPRKFSSSTVLSMTAYFSGASTVVITGTITGKERGIFIM